MNYFDLFSLSKKFDINNKELSKKLYQLQKKFHPDLCKTLSIRDQRNFLKKSILINQGYFILKNPLERGKYLLSLHGIEINDQDYFSCDDKDFLNKQFDLNEQIDVFSQSKTRLNNCIALLKDLCVIENRFFKKMENYFSENKWYKAKKYLIKLIFLQRIKVKAEEVKEKLSEIS